MAQYSSDSLRNAEPYDEKAFRESDHQIAALIVHLFGAEDDVMENYSASIINNNNQKKKKKNGCRGTSSNDRILRKRRYRSIDNLYMVTKPVYFLERKKYCI